MAFPSSPSAKGMTRVAEQLLAASKLTLMLLLCLFKMWLWLAQWNCPKACFPFNSPLLDIKVKHTILWVSGKEGPSAWEKLPRWRAGFHRRLEKAMQSTLPLEDKRDIKNNSLVVPQSKTRD